MTADNFTKAAEAEAARLYPSDGIDILESRGLDGFAIGVIWARDYLATQKPTGAEVEAAAKAIYLFEGGYHTEASWEREKATRRDHYLTSALAALSAARKA